MFHLSIDDVFKWAGVALLFSRDDLPVTIEASAIKLLYVGLVSRCKPAKSAFGKRSIVEPGKFPLRIVRVPICGRTANDGLCLKELIIGLHCPISGGFLRRMQLREPGVGQTNDSCSYKCGFAFGVQYCTRRSMRQLRSLVRVRGTRNECSVLYCTVPTSRYEVTCIGNASLVHPVVAFGEVYRHTLLGANDVLTERYLGLRHS